MKNVVSGLLKKRKELLYNVAECEQAYNQAKESLSAIESTIRLYHPDIDLPQAPARKRYKRSEYFMARELTPLIRECLRERPEPVSTTDIVKAIAIAKCIDYDSLEYTKQQTFYKAVRKGLYSGKRRGVLDEAFRKRRMIYWQLAQLAD